MSWSSPIGPVRGPWNRSAPGRSESSAPVFLAVTPHDVSQDLPLTVGLLGEPRAQNADVRLVAVGVADVSVGIAESLERGVEKFQVRREVHVGSPSPTAPTRVTRTLAILK